MTRLTQDSVRRIIEQVDIIDLISKYVSLKIKGSEASGLCPFHNEKSPSFTVSRNKQFFYCFGCHAKGNAIDFVMQQQKLTFPEAITHLAELYSINIDYEVTNQSTNIDYTKLHQILQTASDIYQRSLKQSKSVIDYCKKRELSGTIAKQFGLGFASDQPSLFSLTTKYERSILDNSGLWASSSTRERFKNRLTFPITNPQGKVIGFGGRALKDDQQPKYLNSPETPLFHKSKALYGMSQALKKPLDYWVVVEGYMDVLLCHQHNITQAVAALGTAFTIDHFKLLTRYCNKIIFCFDGDKAGERALHRTMNTLLHMVTDQHDIRCIHLPNNDDPDQFLRTHGAEKFNHLIEKSQRWEDYWEQTWEQGLQLDKLTDKAKYLQRAQESFEHMPNSYLKQLWLTKLQQQSDTKIMLRQPKHNPSKQIASQTPATDCIRWLIESEHYVTMYRQIFENFQAKNELTLEILAWTCKYPNDNQPTNFWIESARNSPLATLISEAQTPTNNPIIPFADCVRWLQRNALESAIGTLLALDTRSNDENIALKKYLELKHLLQKNHNSL